MNSAFRWAAAS